MQNNTTLRVMRTACRRFSKWCKESNITKMKAIKKDEAVETIQRYADYLTDRGYAPSTIHTYLAAPCKALRVWD